MTAHRPLLPVVGVDITSTSRVWDILQRRPRFAERVFTEAERRRATGHPERFASRWAAKEAVRKVLGSLGMAPPFPAWREIEVVNARGGAPSVRVRGQAQPLAISLTHDADLAIAVAVALPGAFSPEGSSAAPQGMRLPPRPADANKGTFGTVVVVAGSHGFSGAAYLSAMGAARGGAGLTRLCVPQSLLPIMAVKCTEVMAHGLPDDGSGVLGGAGVETLRAEHLPAADVLVIGPGLGRAAPTEAAVEALLRDLPCPAVVDADGLNIAAARDLDWRLTGRPVVLTPHPAEMGRLVHTDARDVQSRRREVAAGYATERGATVVLKGAETIIAAPDGRLHVDDHRLVALASGGTGDVLAGLCGAMLAGGLDTFDAAVAAVSVHAEAGAAVQAARGRAGALASDLLEELPAAQERLRESLESR